MLHFGRRPAPSVAPEANSVLNTTDNGKAQQTSHTHLQPMKRLCLIFVFALFSLLLSTLSLGQRPQTDRPVIPKTWETEAIESFQLPLADTRVSAKLISSSYYYSIPVRPIYKSYAVYRPDHEPPGYMDELKRK